MEYKSSRKIGVFALFSIVLMVGCGYFEKDGTEYEIDVVGNIKLVKQEGDKTVNLMIQDSDVSYFAISEDCRRVFYDSLNKVIFVEEFINEFNSNWYKIDVLDATAKLPYDAVKKHLISRDKFDHFVKDINGKQWQFNQP